MISMKEEKFMFLFYSGLFLFCAGFRLVQFNSIYIQVNYMYSERLDNKGTGLNMKIQRR
jgi:hypothetical protein